MFRAVAEGLASNKHIIGKVIDGHAINAVACLHRFCSCRDKARKLVFHFVLIGPEPRRGAVRLEVFYTGDLSRALLATGFPYDRHTNPDNNLGRFGAALTTSQGMRRAGSAALDLAAVASGWLDGYWEDRLQPWDLGAGALLVTEAGGVLTDLDTKNPMLAIEFPEEKRKVVLRGTIVFPRTK